MVLPAYTSPFMRQTATYWPPGASDGLGGNAVLSPVLIICRWQDMVELFIDADGKEQVSEAVVYVDRVLLNKGFLALGSFGTFTDPFVIETSKEIRQVGFSPDLKGTKQLNKVWL